MSDKMVRHTDPGHRETIGFIKGTAVGAAGTAVLLTLGFWPTVFVAGGIVVWRGSSKVRKLFSGKK